jgi:hypothetical protein
VRKVYYDQNLKRQLGFRGGAMAYWFKNRSAEFWDDCFGEFVISEPLYWALFHLDILDQFNELHHSGIIAAYEECILFSSSLEQAAILMREIADTLTSEEYDWPCGKQVSPELVDFRILVKTSDLRRDLIDMAEFMEKAQEHGFDVQLVL